MQTLLEHLNPEQLAAVTLPAQSALILAGAGSGKTRVLTTRIAWLLNTRGMWIGTFHGLCNRLLRTHWRDAALPQSFQILDTQDQLSAVRRLLKAAQADEDKFPPRSLAYCINQYKEKGLRAADVVPHDDYEQRIAAYYALYEAQCQREGVVDFAELLLRSYELLSRNEMLREHYQARFRHILVDEFQDTNDLQYQWLKLMAGGGAAVFAVGDDDQSIYAFRGANVGNMMAFRQDFHVQNLIRLEQNYRSHGHILEAANTLIAHNSQRLGKNLYTQAGDGEPVRVYEATSDISEAQYLVEEIRNLLAEGWLRSEIAILYRSNAQSRVIEHTLVGAGLPYRVYGGLRFFERAEIRHALAYLQLMDNPHNDSAFLRVVNFPARGIGARSIEQLQEMARLHGGSLYAAIPHVSGKAGNALAGFARLIEGARFETQQMPLPEMVQTVIARSGLIAHYRTEKEGADRIENLEQLVSAATLFLHEENIPMDMPALFASRAVGETAAVLAGTDMELVDAEEVVEVTPLTAFLTHASLEAGENQAQAGQDALQLMTVHSAKGLEFDAVFITGLEAGLFPHENSVQEADGLEEERRLMYVAITRARKRLYMSYAQSRMLHGQTRYGIASRFLDELPEGALKRLTPKKQAYWFGAPSQESKAVVGKVAEPLAMAVTARGSSWRIGETVFHQKFGEGVIVSLEGGGEHPRANVNFGKAGMKLLDLGIAKLERRG